MIGLTTNEKRWIKLCKGHYDAKYGITNGNYLELLKPLYKELYMYDPEEHPKDFLMCMYNVLFDIYMKITDDRSREHIMLKEIISASFEEPFYSKEISTPLERVVRKIVSQIRYTTVVDGGKPRFSLSIDGEPDFIVEGE